MDQRYSQKESHRRCSSNRAAGTIRRRPVPAALVAFGMGFGVGVTVVSLLSESSRSSSLAHRVGHQMLDAMHATVPKKLLKQWQ